VVLGQRFLRLKKVRSIRGTGGRKMETLENIFAAIWLIALMVLFVFLVGVLIVMGIYCIKQEIKGGKEDGK
jgi:hypothetical protein